MSLDLTYRNQIADFTVTDTGLGISPADLARIFEPFERGTNPAAQSAPGTGLGLTIAQLLAQIMGGEISVSSELGRGTRFQVRLMLASVHDPAPASLPAALPPTLVTGYAGVRRTILVADDDDAHRVLMREILEPLGFTVLEAPDGPTCLALADGRRPDLFLLDIAMPGMSGWELAKSLRASGHAARIVMMSANVHEISPMRGDDAPHDDIIPKPFDLRHLLERVAAHLDLAWSTPEPDLPATTMPRPDHVAELARLGRIGHVRAIQAKLAEIEAEDGGGQAAFVLQMRGLVEAYDLRRYMSVLDAYAAGEGRMREGPARHG